MPDWEYAYSHYGSEDRVLLYYNKYKNILVDEDGFIVYDMYVYITPNEFMIFRNIELVWPEEPWSDLTEV